MEVDDEKKVVAGLGSASDSIPVKSLVEDDVEFGGSGADSEEGADAAVDFRPAGGGPSDTREDLEQSGLPRTVAADGAEDLPFHSLAMKHPGAPRPFLRFSGGRWKAGNGRTFQKRAVGSDRPAIRDGSASREIQRE
jgi:hypothetical protein